MAWFGNIPQSFNFSLAAVEEFLRNYLQPIIHFIGNAFSNLTERPQQTMGEVLESSREFVHTYPYTVAATAATLTCLYIGRHKLKMAFRN